MLSFAGVFIKEVNLTGLEEVGGHLPIKICLENKG